MRIYLLRHGETIGNIRDAGQSPDDPMTENGIDQVKKTARALIAEFKNRETFPDLLISSPYKRTTESSRVILEVFGDAKKLTYKESQLFVERVRPTEQVGKSKTDPEFARIDAICNIESKKDWHYAYSAGESMADTVERAHKALAYITEEGKKIEDANGGRDAERGAVIVVVSHSYFLRAMLGCMVFGERMNYEKLQYCIEGFECYNGSISVVRKDLTGNDKGKWNVVSWNQTEHLLVD